MPKHTSNSKHQPDSGDSLPEPEPSPAEASFPIVGIGASAGGLEALELFLANVPSNSGLAFVIVQHLDPTHQGILAELLQRSTAMSVAQIQDGMTVRPDCVYLIPPNCDLSLLHGVLHVLEPTAARGLRLPVDFFFRSLAEDLQEKSIGVILSGMGSDGTLGMRAIKEKGGATFVQAPASAKFDSMPRSAVETGLVDVVTDPEKLGQKIIDSLVVRPARALPSGLEPIEKDSNNLEKVILLLRSAKGNDFSHYKRNTLYRRVERRMGLHQLAKFSDYVRYLQANAQEIELLFKELLIGVTRFFRDPTVWEELKTKVIPYLLAAYPEGCALRAWSAACSTGEEAYSLAMIFREAIDELQPKAQYTLQIFATDLDDEAIVKARSGMYPVNIASDVSETRLRRFFVQSERGFQVVKEVRDIVIFAHQNLLKDPPFTKLNLLLCRNLLIYLDADLQKKLLPLFHYSLNPGGVLVLGSSESIGSAADLLTALPGNERFYRRRGSIEQPQTSEMPAMLARSPLNAFAEPQLPIHPTFTTSLQGQTDALLLKSYAPAAVLTTEQGDIVYISGKTGKYLEPAAGKANLNIFAMARDGLNRTLNTDFHQAVRKREPVVSKGLKIGTNGGAQYVDLTVHPLNEPTELQSMMLIVFADAPAPIDAETPGRSRRKGASGALVTALEKKLQQSEEALQIASEEMQASREELQSTNEELQSTNEELQSANEELTTSKEEMQSMNEELQTVNQELMAKIDGLSRANDDMSNLLNTLDIAALFLDASLKVRRFTAQMLDIIKLIPGDIGRPMTDLVNKLDYPQLAQDASEVLRLLKSTERLVSAKHDHWYRVRIMPYRTRANQIDGVVITFIDITLLKGMEGTLRDAYAVLQGRFDSQATELEHAKTLECVLRAAQTVLEERLTNYAGGGHSRPLIDS
jgi:two-component system, chemotaxis family, CheB/CheR fusion protein